MANEEHLGVLRQGVDTWNAWREERSEREKNPNESLHLREADLRGANLRGANLGGTVIRGELTGADLRRANLREADLRGANLICALLYKADLIEADLRGAKLHSAKLGEADLRGAKLGEADLRRADFRQANFSGTDLRGADLRGANLSKADLRLAKLNSAKLGEADLCEAKLDWAKLGEADLSGAKLILASLFRANLSGANLSGADLSGAGLSGADLSGANLSGANLSRAILVLTDFANADLTGCRIYGVSAWDLKLEGAKQENLIITSHGQSEVTVDNLEVAQFIYLLLHNQKIRDVIDTITSKAVLILGRFKPERKAVLDALREELRKHDYLPILFDFDVPANRDITETVSLLARMARFIVADLTEPRSIPAELAKIVPDLAVPVQPLLEGSTRPYAMFEDYWKYNWVLPVYRYEGLETLRAALLDKVVAPAEAKVKALKEEKRQAIEAKQTKVE